MVEISGKDTIDVMFRDVSDGKVIIGDDGSYRHRYFRMQDITGKLYEANLANIISLHPDPVIAGEPFTVKNLLHHYHENIKVVFYNHAEKPVKTVDLTMENTPLH